MRFETEKNQVMCIREYKSESGAENSRVIASFDAHLVDIAPHILAKLSEQEQEDLNNWLKDRDKLRERSIKEIILYALPDLLAKAESVIGEVAVSDELRVELHKALISISQHLNDLPENEGKQANEIGLKQMNSEQALKEVLNLLHKSI